MSSSSQADAPPAPAGRKKTFVLLGGGLVVLLLGAGIVVFATRKHPVAEDPGAGEAQPADPSETSVVELEPFVVNLADQEDDRYLRVTVRVVVDGKAVPAEEESGMSLERARLRDRILTLLTGKSAEEITTFEGKEALRLEIGAEITPLLPENRVLDVLFTEFLVQ
jgi:flagellar FliL protein